MTSRASVDRVRRRPPPLETALSNAQSSGQNAPLSSPKPHTPSLERHPEVEQSALPLKPGYQRFVLADPVAFRYLSEDSSTTVLDPRRELRGYECYVVEQWTTSRTHPTFMITTYTGDPTHVIMVGVMSVPTDENIWSPRLRVYFKALNQYHARRRDTPLGILMVTNLSGFPSSLTVIPVPDGDVRKHRFDFFVNENLKRLGCSGRTGLSLAQPAATTVVKFHQLYRTSDKNDIYKAVLELVKLCQSALTLFDKLEIDYADGLLCDVTEKAINDWWVDIGSENYNIEPHDGILGPTTVAGLLGLLMGARNRLHAVNAPVTKDPFDVESMKRGVSYFQKQQRMPRTRRLDRRTLDRLHKVTQKAADKERWAVPKAVKSTVAELSGKGGEMVMEAVGRRDRAGIGEIETVDIDRFVQLVYGDRAKWLWLGRPMKKAKGHDGQERVPEEVQGEPSLNKGLVFKPDDHGGFTWTTNRSATGDKLPTNQRQPHQNGNDDLRPVTNEEVEDSDEANYSFFKRATTLKDDAKTGFGKVRGAVGLGHRHKHSTEESAQASPVEQDSKDRRPLLRRALSSPTSSPSSPSAQDKDIQAMPAVAEQSDRLNVVLGRKRAGTAESRSTREQPSNQLTSNESLTRSVAYTNEQSTDEQEEKQEDTDPSRTATASIAGSIYNGVDLNDALPTGPETENDISNLLRRTISDSQYIDIQIQSHSQSSNPRHLSFSLAEESILHWRPVTDDSSSDENNPFLDGQSSLLAQLKSASLSAKESKRLRHLITLLHSQTAAWTSSQIILLQTVLERQDRDQETLDSLHQPHLQNVREIQLHSEGILREVRDRLEEGVKEIETVAAKLEYEISALRSKVEDVEAGVGDFEKGVERVEERVGELEREGEGKGWRCIVQ